MSQDSKGNKQEEVTLPKSTIISFVKEVLAPQKLKCEKLIFDLIEKISIKYINFISKEASDFCFEKGKKTLNVDHVIEALKKHKFDSHLKKIVDEDLKENNEDDEEGDKKEIAEDPMEMKEFINKKKKRSNKNSHKKNFQYDEESMRQQMDLFEKSKHANMLMHLNNTNNMNGNGFSERQNQQNLSINHVENQEIDFDS